MQAVKLALLPTKLRANKGARSSRRSDPSDTPSDSRFPRSDDPNLAKVIAGWRRLPATIRTGILAMFDAVDIEAGR